MSALTRVTLSLQAVLDEDGNAVCGLSCNGQEAKITFTGDHILIDISEPAQVTPGGEE